MSFGPRKPTIPSRPSRPGVVKKPLSKTVTRNEATIKQQQVVKPKGSSSGAIATVAPKKIVPVAPKPSPLKAPTPEPVYDYESDFESDQSMPSAGCSSTESSAENTESNSSSSEGGDDEEEDDAEEEKLAIGPQDTEKQEVKTQTIAAKNSRSVDILSKISLNDITVQLYRFDPEEYAELRTNFGITSTVAYGKHTQTDCALVSTASQTSTITVRDRSTCMQEGFRSLRCRVAEEEDWQDRMHGDEDDDGDDGEVQNYSSLQNIERMFCTLNGALERRFSKVSGSARLLPTQHDRRNQSQQRSILQLLRKASPIVEALLESRRNQLKTANSNEREEHLSDGTNNVVRSFDAGKMCPEFEIKLVHSKSTEASAPMEYFVLEFWARGTYSRPMYRFSSWSTIVCVDYEFRKSMMVFGGTSDGTLQMWLGDAGRCHNAVLPPHQIVAPNVPRKHKLNCWQMVAVKVLPVPVIRDSSLEIGCENAFNQVFGLFSSGIIVVWNVQIQKQGTVSADDVLSAKLSPPEVTLVQSKVMDLTSRIGGRLPYDALRTFENLLLHDHHQMVMSSNHGVIRLSHFVQSEYDPVLLIHPDPSHTIINLKRMVQANDTLFVLYSNKTVRVLKLCTEPGGRESAQSRHRKHDDQPHLMLSVCTNKSCTIQSIVHDEAKRYGNSNGSGEGRADGGGGGMVPKAVERGEKGDGEMCAKPRFHHGQQILFFDAHHPDGMLKDVSYCEQRWDNSCLSCPAQSDVCRQFRPFQRVRLKMVSDSQKRKAIKEFLIPDTLKDDIAYCQRSLRDCVKVHQYFAQRCNSLSMIQQGQVKQYLLELEDEMRAIGKEQNGLVQDLAKRLKHFQRKTASEKHIELGDDLAN
uniref:Uncharacterized protein n=1 Tax=Anopheles christyi TaxID=43041 RepID=A0A182JS16_9DIPT